MMMMIMRHPVALFISTVIGFTIHKTQCLMIELELFVLVPPLCRAAAAATTVGVIPPNSLFYSGIYMCSYYHVLLVSLSIHLIKPQWHHYKKVLSIHLFNQYCSENAF